jgi:hypothetical protein
VRKKRGEDLLELGREATGRPVARRHVSYLMT